jgi:hypothetical protein
MDLNEFVSKEVKKLIKESNFYDKDLEEDIVYYSSKDDKEYELYASLEAETDTSDFVIYHARTKDGISVKGEEEIKNLFTDEEWKNVRSELEGKFDKEIEYLESWRDTDESEPNPDDVRDAMIDRGDLEESAKFIQEEIVKFHNKTLLEFRKTRIENELKLLTEEENNNPNNLPLASGNPLNGKSKESAKNLIRKIFGQIDHGQQYRDEAWENVKKIFKLFGDYNIDIEITDAKYNPGGISVDTMSPKWKAWNVDFNFISKEDRPLVLHYVLTAHAAGTVENPWDSYDISFYPTN